MAAEHGSVDDAEGDDKIEILWLEQEPNEGDGSQERHSIVVAADASLVEVFFPIEVPSTEQEKQKSEPTHEVLFLGKYGVVRPLDGDNVGEVVGEQGQVVGDVGVGDEEPIGSDDAEQRCHPTAEGHGTKHSLHHPVERYEIEYLWKEVGCQSDEQKLKEDACGGVRALIGREHGEIGGHRTDEHQMSGTQMMEHGGSCAQHHQAGTEHSATDAQEGIAIVQCCHQIYSQGTQQEPTN